MNLDPSNIDAFEHFEHFKNMMDRRTYACIIRFLTFAADFELNKIKKNRKLSMTLTELSKVSRSNMEKYRHIGKRTFGIIDETLRQYDLKLQP